MLLEDDFTDIIKKARQGQRLAVEDVAKQGGLHPGTLSELERGGRTPTPEEVHGIASALGLRAGPLAGIALQQWSPSNTPGSVTEVKTVRGDIGGYEVKGYIVFDAGAREAVMIDTGYNPDSMLALLDEQGLRLKAVCLTHGHTDHAGGLDRILERWPVPVYLGTEDRDLSPWLPGDELLARMQEGTEVVAGALTVHCMETPGHTPGGICYRVKTDTHDICFVGDTLFAGSIGRSNPFSLYPAHLQSVRTRVLTLPVQTLLFPGHGPATSVAEEREHNPFSTET